MRVLIADDDRVVTQQLAAILRPKRIETLIAVDGMQAMMHAVRGQPDLIVLDIHMPGGTGFETLRKLKASGKTMTIPVIAISADPAPDVAAEARALGADGFLAKPIDPTQFYEQIVALTNPPGGPSPAPAA
jgi:CheY-like chemotaxis protein